MRHPLRLLTFLAFFASTTASSAPVQKTIDFEDIATGPFPTLEAPMDIGDGFYAFSHSQYAGDTRYTVSVYETGLGNGRALRDTGAAAYGAGLAVCRFDETPFRITSIDAGDFEPGADSREPMIYGSVGGYDWAGTTYSRYLAASLDAPEGEFATFPLDTNSEVCWLIGVMDYTSYDESVDNIVLEWESDSADCVDADGDGFGVSGTESCEGGTEIDCDDLDSSVYPGASELCDGRDNDCDGVTPVAELDLDGDGFSECEGYCDDGNSAINPMSIELTGNLVDENCDGSLGACDPEAGYSSPGEFIRCVASEANSLKSAGYLTPQEANTLVKDAARTEIRCVAEP